MTTKFLIPLKNRCQTLTKEKSNKGGSILEPPNDEGNIEMIKITVLAALLFSAINTMAGEKVIVVLKSNSAFEYERAQFKKKNDMLTKGIISFGLEDSHSMASVDAQVESELKNINTLILDLENPEDIEKLQSLSHVALVEKEVLHPLPTFRGSVYKRSALSPMADVNPGQFKQTAKTPWGILAVKAQEAWNDSAYGQNSRVLVLDTGIDKNHISLKNNIENTKDFVGDNNSPYDVWDQVGHGTHVAGTIAGQADSSGFVGVAPKAKILAGRVCSHEGCSNVAVAKGINWGIEQKVDVVSMSLGGSFATPSERMAVQKALRAGVTVVAASGNDGTSKVSYPAALAGVIAVGATDEKDLKADFSQYGPELTIVAPGVAVVSSVPSGSGKESKVVLNINGVAKEVNSTMFDGTMDLTNAMSGDVVDAGLGKVEDFAGKNVNGKIVLIKRGEIKFLDKIDNAINAKAKGIILYNNQPGLLNGSLSADGTILPIGLAMIEEVEGEALKKSLETGAKALATIQSVPTSYASFDGTSMATPHVAGVVALVKSANKKLLPEQVKSILVKTAKPLGPNNNNEYGAGLIDAEKAVKEALNTK